MTYVLVLVAGYVLGLIHKGIHIHVHKEGPKQQEGYNESLAPLLPPEVQNYYKQTQGHNTF
jgi:hypothetical protein